jgi:hypothetical protein
MDRYNDNSDIDDSRGSHNDANCKYSTPLKINTDSTFKKLRDSEMKNEETSLDKLLNLLANSPQNEAVSPPPLYSSKSMGTIFSPEMLRKDSQSSWGKFGASNSFGVDGVRDEDNDLRKNEEKNNSHSGKEDNKHPVSESDESVTFNKGSKSSVIGIGDDFDEDDEERVEGQEERRCLFVFI